jgi:hypothetical protein
VNGQAMHELAAAMIEAEPKFEMWAKRDAELPLVDIKL